MTSVPAPEPERASDDPSARSPLILLLGGYFALYGFALLVAKHGTPAFELLADIAYLPFRAITMLLLFQAASATRDPDIARGWRLLAWGQVLQVIGNVQWVVSDYTGQDISNPAYVAWSLPSNALHLAAFWVMMRAPREDRRRTTDWLDAAVMTTAGAVLAWFFLAREVARVEAPELASIAVFLFTGTSNIAILFFALAVWLRGPLGLSRAAIVRLVIAFALFTIADLVFESQSVRNTYQSGSWLDMMYAGSVIVVALGADAQRRRPVSDPPQSAARRWPIDTVPLVATAIALVPLLVTALRADLQGNPIAGIAVGLVVLTLLVLWRSRMQRAQIERLVRGRIQLEQQLWQAQKMEAVGRLAGGIAHDFNNILAVISSHAQLLRSMGTSATSGELEEIEFAAQRAGARTRRLLDFSRTSTSDARPVLLAEVVRSMQPMLSRLLAADISFTLDVADGDAAVALADGQLEQVLLNLAINARDAMPTGGHLSIATRRASAIDRKRLAALGVPDREWAVIEVRDDGGGMDEPTRTRLFEPFFTTKPRGRGTGLGLATVDGIVRGAGGHVLVDSDVGRGTTMTVLLPVADASVLDAAPRVAIAPAPAQAPTPEAGGANPRILVVDDELAIRSVIARFFSRIGYDMVEAADGASALAALETNDWRIDLVITDVEMPRMSGLELARRIHQRDPSLPILYMSGYVDGRTRSEDGDDAPSGDTLMKPFDFAVLVERVTEALHGTTGTDENRDKGQVRGTRDKVEGTGTSEPHE
jgi:signal transduction histidine kinase/CheY-like chemotaxis protein